MDSLTKIFFSIFAFWLFFFLFFYSGFLDVRRYEHTHSLQSNPPFLHSQNQDSLASSQNDALLVKSIESETVQSLTAKLKYLQNLFSEKNQLVQNQQQLIESLKRDITSDSNLVQKYDVAILNQKTNQIPHGFKRETGRKYIPVEEVRRLSALQRDFMKEEKWENKNNHSKITVLTWDYGRGGGWAYLGANPLRAPNYLGQDVHKTCPIECEITGEKKDMGRAHAIIFEAQSHQGHDWQREPLEFPLKFWNQKWISFGYEQWLYFPLQVQKTWKQYMDFNMTFEERDPVQITFTCSWGGGELIDYLARPPQKKTKLMAAIISNCGGGGAFGRIRYLRELMKYLPIDSYGGCEHNIDLPPEMQGQVYADHGKAMRNKIKLFKDYKFVLAFENNNVTDYITEKVYNVLQAGSVPIYMGSSTIDDWIPGEHSIIRTDQFKGPKDLADYVKKLDQNDDLYNEYFEWKKRGLFGLFHR